MCPVTAESVNRQPMGNQQVRIAVLIVVLLAAIGVVLWLVLGNSSNKKTSKPATTSSIGPIGYTAAGLRAESVKIHTRFYWAGAQAGTTYEFTRDIRGYLYVRYLPSGTTPGVPGANYLIVATYPFPGAFAALKKEAGDKAVSGPNDSIIYVRPKDHRSVLMAFPGVDDQIEIYNPSPVAAIAAARSGKIKPVR
jgi:hypothetical protein